MAENPNRQTPATLNQIEAEKPVVPRSFNLLTGALSGSFNAGHYHTIAYREVMAGEHIAVEGAELYIQTATPKTPAYQNLIANVKVFHVPHERVFKNYPKFAAQNGGSTEEKIEELPNFAGKYFPEIKNSQNEDTSVSMQETTLWRDSFASCYIPRVGGGYQINSQDMESVFREAPPINALLIRGWVAIWNDKLRNKEYEEAREEYNGDTVTGDEWNSYMYDSLEKNRDYYTARCRRNNSYYTNYRTEAQGYELEPADVPLNEYALNYANYEAQFAEARSQAENAQMNAWDVMQKIKGAKKLTQGRVTLIGERNFPLNYSAITQNAYNNNEQIEERFRAMGTQGAYSYTNIDLGFLNNVEIEEDGYLHIVISVTAETVFESGIDRTLLNNRWDSRYRPDLKDKKLDVIYKCEYGVANKIEDLSNEPYNEVVGFKRAFTENFKLPNCINGETQNRGYYLVSNTDEATPKYNGERILPYDTYQFYEANGFEFLDTAEQQTAGKKIWLDYTDTMLDKNLAYRMGVKFLPEQDAFIMRGQTQIFYVGKHYAVTDMPIDEAIKNNFTKWGEH